MPAPSGRWSESKAFEEASLSPTWTLTLELAVAIMVSLKARARRHRAPGSIDFLGKMGRHRREKVARIESFACRHHSGGPSAAVQDASSRLDDKGEIGRASCRERVGQYVYISVVAVSFKKNTEAPQDKKQ